MVFDLKNGSQVSGGRKIGQQKIDFLIKPFRFKNDPFLSIILKYHSPKGYSFKIVVIKESQPRHSIFFSIKRITS